MAHQKYIFVILKLLNEVLKGPKCCFRSQRIGDLDGAVCSDLGCYQGGGLQGTLQAAGRNEIKVHLQRIQVAADQKALPFSFFI